MNKWLYLLFGAAIGGGVGYTVAHQMYSKRLISEIQSLKEAEDRRFDDAIRNAELTYETKLSKYVSNCEDTVEEPVELKKKEKNGMSNKPRHITMDEYENPKDGYDQVEWSFYEEDGILVDELGNEVLDEDIEQCVGDKFAQTFDTNELNEPDYNPDITYFECPRYKIVYKISRIPYENE